MAGIKLKNIFVFKGVNEGGIIMRLVKAYIKMNLKRSIEYRGNFIMTNKEIFQLVYRQTMFAIKEGKSEKDIAFFIYNISKTTNKNFLDVTSVLLNNKKIVMKISHIDEDMDGYDQIIRL